MGDIGRTEPRSSIGPRRKVLLDLGRVTWSNGRRCGVENPPRVRGRTVAEALGEDRR